MQADLKTFSALGVYGMSALTAVTVQDTERVFRIYAVPPDIVYEQIKAVVEDMGVDAVKVGMLWSGETVRAVVRAVREFNIEKLVLDTVLRSTGGTVLLDGEGLKSLREELLPLSLLVTPNVPEAEELCGIRIRGVREMEECARRILSMGARAVVIKGGHLEGEKVLDLFYEGGSEFHYLVSDRVEGRCFRGTGCTLSAAITAFVARGCDLMESVRLAKDYVTGAIRESFALGKGCRLLNHLWKVECA